MPVRHRAIPPGWAIGFLFIPVYNFYWVFVTWSKLAEGYEAWGAEKGCRVAGGLRGIGVAQAVLFVASFTLFWIPLLDAVSTIAALVIFILYYKEIVRLANGLMGQRLPSPSAASHLVLYLTNPQLSSRRSPHYPMKLRTSFPLLAAIASLSVQPASAQDDAAEMARKLQDPLANVTALMTDNDISWGTGNDDVSYGFQLQPVKAFSFDDINMNFIARAVIPIVGAASESQRPLFGEPREKDDRGAPRAAISFC